MTGPSPLDTTGKSLVSTLIIVSIMILVPAILALVLYLFLLRPMLAAPVVEEPVVEGALPETMQMIQFEKKQASVLPQGPDEAAPLLMYSVSFACKDPETAAVIEAKKAWFEAKLLELHSNRTRKELDDPKVREAIERQAKQDANSLLQRLAPGKNMEVLEVMHTEFTVVDL